MTDSLFWSRVDKSGDCWLWLGYRNPAGYGRVNRRGVYTLAHRFAWLDTSHAIPVGMDLCHHCDNPPCVRPDHLFVGTRRDNMADAKGKGRTLSGDRNPSHTRPDRIATGAAHHWARYSEDQVRTVRALYASGMRQADIVRAIGMSQNMVSRIVRGKNWKRLAA